MSAHNLDALFAPRAIALIGASHTAGSVGEVVTRNLLHGGFKGPIGLVNPHAETLDGARCYPDIATLPDVPDLAVVATPAETLPGVIAQLGARGCRAAVVISAGLEGPGRPAELTLAMLAAAGQHRLRILGPNCLGLLSPAAGVNASFAQRLPPAGHIALVAQSGAVAAAAMDWARSAGVGFSHVVTVGDCADIDVADVLDHLADDDQTHAILVYLEGVADGRKFMAAARRAAWAKPVAVIKAGRSAAGAKAALSHTGALAGAAAVYDAAFRRAGLLVADDLEDFLQAAANFSAGLSISGDRLAILTNGGGAGVLAVDAMAALGERLAELSPETVAALDSIAPPAWSHRNPVDILGDAHPRLYGQALGILLAAPEVDAVLALNCPTAVADSAEAAAEVVSASAARAGKPVLTAWLGGEGMANARARLAAAHLPSFETPEAGARAFAQLTGLRRSRELQAHPSDAGDGPSGSAAGRAIIVKALAVGRSLLTDPEARELLAAYGVPVIPSVTAATPAAAAEAARVLPAPVALKILSRDITHKSDVGGVRLGLTQAQVGEAAERMLAAVTAARSDAKIDGFIVEPMIGRPDTEEMLIGIVRDPTFGPVIMVGQGGVAVEVAADRALALPPLNDALARDMIGRTRIARRLAGYRDRKPADVAALVRVLIALGQLAIDLPEVAELDINPLLCDADGVLALDARVVLKPITAQLHPARAHRRAGRSIRRMPSTIPAR
jgi:acetyltransferase